MYLLERMTILCMLWKYAKMLIFYSPEHANIDLIRSGRTFNSFDTASAKFLCTKSAALLLDNLLKQNLLRNLTQRTKQPIDSPNPTATQIALLYIQLFRIYSQFFFLF